jgi:hypothetical protein
MGMIAPVLLTDYGCSVPGISAVPHEDNLRYFDVEIHGPSQSPYEGKLCLARQQTTASECRSQVLTGVMQAVFSNWSSSSPTTIP